MIRFTLNGIQIEVQDGESRTLLEFLRNVRCMKGTKEACGTGHCGACSVLVDGKLMRSCVTLLRRVDGKTVETIENAPHDTMLQTIQRSFLDVGAVQCGFCTPGMVMATKALLLHDAAPDEREIYEGLKNNYCRCTGYVKIIEAVKLAAARLRGETPDIDSFRTHESTVIVVGENQIVPPITGSAVGKSVWDVDGMDKTGGKLKFCDDLTAEDIGADTLLHGAFVWAPAPHAKINAVDYSAAEQAEGVVRIVTAADVPGMNKVGTWTPEQPVFCTDEVRFLGDHLALVVADTAAHARAAVKLVKIDYEELPGIYTTKTASSCTPAASAAMWSRQSSGRTLSSSTSPRILSRRSTPAWSRFRLSAWCRTAKRSSIPAHRRRLKSAVCWQRFWTSRRRISALS